MSPISLLIINPNSSEKVTNNLKGIIQESPGVSISYYTAPEEAPKEIDGNETSAASEQVVLPDVLSKSLLDQYDGFLVGCYSDHPLIYSLSKHTSKPVMGIMQATLLYSLSRPSTGKSFVLTSFNEWEPLLDKAIVDFTGSNSFPSRRFQRTRGLDVSVLSLSDPKEFEKIYNRVDSILNSEYADDVIDCVLLGCAGMAGLDIRLSESFPGVDFIDSVKIGVELLTGIISFKQKNN